MQGHKSASDIAVVAVVGCGIVVFVLAAGQSLLLDGVELDHVLRQPFLLLETGIAEIAFDELNDASASGVGWLEALLLVDRRR